MPMLSLDSVSKNFGGNTVVDQVSFTVEPGEIFALIGPNGSGKTTLVKMICGLLRPNAGQIKVDGQDVCLEPVATKANIGYIPDEPAVWPAMTGVEFLHFVGALYRLAAAEREKRIKALLKIFNLSGIGNSYFEDYSRGNKQKFVILSALLHQPKLLLIDEPIVGLDPESASQAKETLVEFARKGGAVLLVTHTLSVAQAIADKIGLLQGGKLLTCGTFDELQAKSKLGKKASLEEVYLKLTA